MTTPETPESAPNDGAAEPSDQTSPTVEASNASPLAGAAPGAPVHVWVMLAFMAGLLALTEWTALGSVILDNFSLWPVRWGVWSDGWGPRPSATEWAYGSPLQAPLTLLTSAFLHIGWFHFVSNAVFLLVTGRVMALLRPRGAAAEYVAGFLFFAAAGGLLSLGFAAAFPGEAPQSEVGASGGACGLFTLAFLRLREAPGIRRDVITSYLTAFVAFSVLGAFAITALGLMNIGWQAHLGGILAGIGWHRATRGPALPTKRPDTGETSAEA
jgi:membrane associated rhomboid family serine protease